MIKNLLDSDEFKLGLEYEFVVYDFFHAIDSKWMKIVSVKDLLYYDLLVSLKVSPSLKKELDIFLNVAVERCGKERIYFDDMVNQMGVGRIIATYGIAPKWGWFSKTKKGFINRTAYVNNMIKSVDTTDYEAIENVARKIERYYAKIVPVNSYGQIVGQLEKEVQAVVGKEIAKITGKLPKNVDSFDYEKNQTEWCISDEWIDSIDGNKDEYGIELKSPPMNARKQLEYYRKISAVLLSIDLPVKIKLKRDTGLHVNISHPSVKPTDGSYSYFGLMYDEHLNGKVFKRVNLSHCTPAIGEVHKTIRRLVKRGIITLHSLKTSASRKRLIELIEGNIEYGQVLSVDFHKLKDRGYIEYRLAGGSRYLEQYDEVEKHILGLMEFTLKLAQEKHEDWEYIDQIRGIMIQAGAHESQKPSRMETFPDELMNTERKYSQRKRKYRTKRREDLIKSITGQPHAASIVI